MMFRIREGLHCPTGHRLACAGQSLTEFALILPIFLMLVWGVFELGRVVFVFSALNNASREAARFGAATGAGIGTAVQYLDCPAIRQAAQDRAFLAGLSDADIQIGYDTPDGSGGMSVYAQCGDADLDAGDVALGDRIVVTITRQIQPIIPFLPFPEFSPTFVTARTILKDITIGPLECSDGADNDNDGLVDLADDGCTSPDDTTEALCYRLTLFGQPTEGGTLSHNPTFNCANRYIEGFTVKLAVDPDPTYAFDGWQVNGAAFPPYHDTAQNIELVMNEDKDVIAHFHLKTTDLGVTKTANPNPVGSGQTLSYDLTVTNDSITYTDTATSVVITDTLPSDVMVDTVNLPLPGGCTHSGESFGGIVRCELPPIADGTSVSRTIKVKARVVNNDTVITNTVTVSGFEFDPNLTNNTATATSTVIPLTDLWLIDKESSPDPVEANMPFTYEITIGNNGPSQATGVIVTDPLPPRLSFISTSSTSPHPCTAPTGVPGATVECTIGTLDSGATTTVSFLVEALPDASDSVENRAYVSGDQTDPNSTNNGTNDEALDDSEVLSADVAIDKRVPGSAVRDQSYTYYLDVSNNGPSAAPSVVVTDQLPNGVMYGGYDLPDILASNGASCSVNASGLITCNLGDLAINAFHTIEIRVTPTVDTLSATTAEVSSTRADHDMTNNADTEAISVNVVANLDVVKSGPGSINHGETIIYEITVTNPAGSSNATNVTVVDTLPSGNFDYLGPVFNGSNWICTDPPLPPSGAQVTCTLDGELVAGQSASFDIEIEPQEPGSFENTASVTSDEDTTADTSAHPTTVTADVNLTVEKTAELGVAFYQGEPVVYTIDVTNSGLSTANNVTVVDTLPSDVTNVSTSCGTYSAATGLVTCTFATIAGNGGTDSFTITATPTTSGQLVNNVEVTSDEHTTPYSNSATITVSPSVNLNLTKSGAATALAGELFTYTLRVDNFGPSTATNLVIADTLPAGVTFFDASDNCQQPSTQEVTCTVAELIPDMAVTSTLTVTSSAGTMTNEAEVTANEHQLSSGVGNQWDDHTTNVTTARLPGARIVLQANTVGLTQLSFTDSNAKVRSAVVREHQLQ